MEQQSAIINQPGPPVKKVSKAFYLTSYIGSSVGSLIIFTALIVLIVVLSITASEITEPPWGMILGIIGLFLLLYAVLIYCVVISMRLLYKAWQAIQDGHQRTTPGKVVGYSFIPYFNFYWLFQAYWGYAKDYNAFLDRNNPGPRKLSENLFLTYCIASLACIIPGINFIAGIATLAIGAIIISKQCDAINDLAELTS